MEFAGFFPLHSEHRIHRVEPQRPSAYRNIFIRPILAGSKTSNELKN